MGRDFAYHAWVNLLIKFEGAQRINQLENMRFVVSDEIVKRWCSIL